MSVDKIEKIFTNEHNPVTICLEGNIISHESIIRKLSNFLSNTISDETDNHKTGFVFHTGSVCYDALLFVYAYMSALKGNEYSPEKLISSLKSGDMVLYNSSRQHFLRIEEDTNLGTVVVLEMDNKEKMKTRVPMKSWSRIQKYSGTSKKADSRGIKRNSLAENEARKILGKIFTNTDDGSVFNNINVSVIICMTRNKADYYYKNLSFYFNYYEKEYDILLKDIATAAYYTEDDEYPLGQNPSKNEPIIQIASDLSVARELQRNRTDNRKSGIIICGEEAISRSEDDLDDVLKNKKTNYAILSLELSSKFVPQILNSYKGKRFFNCTKDFLLTHCNFSRRDTNNILNDLHNEIDNVIDNQIDIIELESVFDWQTCVSIKRGIHFIAKDNYESEDKDQFIMYAYSILNLFLHSAFTLKDMEKVIDEKNPGIIKAETRIEQLKTWSEHFPANIKEIADKITDNFETFYIHAFDQCEKKNYLLKFISEHPDCKIAIVVERKYYAAIMSETEIINNNDNEKNIFISTAAGFDSKTKYDFVITIGFIEGKHFNPLNCYNSKNILILVYPFEKKLVNVKRKQQRNFISCLNSASTLNIETDEPLDKLFENRDDENVADEITLIDNESSDIVETLRRKYIAHEYNFTGHYDSNISVDSEKIAVLDTKETVFFSKNYKAYVYNESEKEVSEVSVDKLSEGDTIIFTSNDSETKDIVELIMLRRLNEDKYTKNEKEYISKSKYWKNVLSDYKKTENLNNTNLYQQLKKQDIPVQKQAVISWLDEDSHIVSPRKIDSLRSIAILCEDQELFDNAEVYFESCREVKRIRRRILNEIGNAIRNKLCGIIPDPDDDMYDIYQKLDNQMQISTIEYMSDCSRKVPVNKINKPLKSAEDSDNG